MVLIHLPHTPSFSLSKERGFLSTYIMKKIDIYIKNTSGKLDLFTSVFYDEESFDEESFSDLPLYK